MKKVVFFLFLFTLNGIYGQTVMDEKSYIMIDMNKYQDLYLFNKAGDHVNLKVLYHENREQGFNNMGNRPSYNDNDIEIVEAQPIDPGYYEFYSTDSAKVINDISQLKIYSMEDLSKSNKNLFQKSNQYFYFLEKISSEKYKLWKMGLYILE